MLKRLSIGLVVLALVGCVVPAHAQFGVQAGVARDWVRLAEGDALVELLAPLAGATYDVPLADDGTGGLSVGYKGAQSSQSDGLGLLVSQYLIEYWSVEYAGRLEWFAGGQFETWNRSVALEGTEFLGGARAGLRFEVQDLPFEVSYNYSGGSGGAERHGMFFGARLVN